MSRSTLDDIRQLLIAQMERFSDDEICKDEESIRNEVLKSQSLACLAKSIVELERNQLDAYKMVALGSGERCSTETIRKNFNLEKRSSTLDEFRR